MTDAQPAAGAARQRSPSTRAAARRLHAAVSALLLAAALLAAFPVPLAADAAGAVQGVSFIAGDEWNTLTIRLPYPIQPDLYRLSMPNRIVLALPGVLLHPTLTAVTSGVATPLLEKIETHTLMSAAVSAGAASGVRFGSSSPVSFIVAHVKPNVEADVKAAQDDEMMINVVYYRTRPASPPQDVLPQPQNILKNVEFTGGEGYEILDLTFAYTVEFQAYETPEVPRLLLLLSRTSVPETLEKQLRRVKQLTRLFNLEIYNVGAQPAPYDRMKDDREYHFVAFPSPLAVDKIMKNVPGYQSRDAVVALHPAEKVTYSIHAGEAGDRLTVVLQRAGETTAAECPAVRPQPPPYLIHNPPVKPPYTMETENGSVKKIEPL
ncbi:MAG: hypothetical protein AB1742_02760 [bacterium]